MFEKPSLTPKSKQAEEQVPVRSRYLPTLDKLISETPVQGLGYDRFNDAEKRDVDGLLSSVGAGFDDPILKDLAGETILHLIQYARSKPDSIERAQTASAVKTAIVNLRNGS